jgi:hypothetical protein
MNLIESHLVTALFAFNVGIEIGQIILILIVVPILYMIKDYFFYKSIIYPLLSLSIMLIAMVWLVERLFLLNLIAWI